ncbi:MAG: hypothetical protein RMK30_09140 [Anaerolineae bacterium]|nr:hypothetical protein [Anaerolineae bacterium]
MRKWLIRATTLFIMVALLSPSLTYSTGVSLVTYPRNVANAVPYNDPGQDNGPAYRLNNPNETNAPFAVILRLPGYKSQKAYFWLTDDQKGNTVRTYDRFDPGAGKSLPRETCQGGSGSCWLDESPTRPPDLDPVDINADVFFVMVIGQVTGDVPYETLITYTVHYEIGATSGSLIFSSKIAKCYDWYLNWNDNDPESGDPAYGADYVELYDAYGNSYTTAPVDGSGYFEMPLDNGASGQFWSADARLESGRPLRAWVTKIGSNKYTCNELIDAGTGGPTRVVLSQLRAAGGPNPLILAFAAAVMTVAGFVLFRHLKGQ